MLGSILAKSIQNTCAENERNIIIDIFKMTLNVVEVIRLYET
jgi:hypothetical protein